MLALLLDMPVGRWMAGRCRRFAQHKRLSHRSINFPCRNGEERVWERLLAQRHHAHYSAMDELDDEEIPSLIEVPYDSNKVIPVTILTGFLGSGKSTLLNYILTANHGKRIAVIENEFSQGLGIEGMIAKSGVNGDNITNFFELNNGCVSSLLFVGVRKLTVNTVIQICCTVKDDLLRALEQLVLHKDRFDYVLIETTGMANPGPVITSFWSDQNLGSYLLLDGVVCVVDCANILTYLGSSDVEFEVKQQLCFADRVVINKCDLVAPEMVGSCCRMLYIIIMLLFYRLMLSKLQLKP